MTTGECVYILAKDARKYRRDGWSVEPFAGHHGASGYALASREIPVTTGAETMASKLRTIPNRTGNAVASRKTPPPGTVSPRLALAEPAQPVAPEPEPKRTTETRTEAAQRAAAAAKARREKWMRIALQAAEGDE